MPASGAPRRSWSTCTETEGPDQPGSAAPRGATRRSTGPAHASGRCSAAPRSPRSKGPASPGAALRSSLGQRDSAATTAAMLASSLPRSTAKPPPPRPPAASRACDMMEALPPPPPPPLPARASRAAASRAARGSRTNSKPSKSSECGSPGRRCATATAVGASSRSEAAAQRRRAEPASWRTRCGGQYMSVAFTTTRAGAIVATTRGQYMSIPATAQKHSMLAPILKFKSPLFSRFTSRT